MDLNTIILAAKYSEKSLSETQIAHGEFILKVAEITQKNNSELIKIINTNEYKNTMSLKKIVDDLLTIYDNTKDKIIFTEAQMYFVDAEKYKLIGEEHTYKYLKRKCVEKFEKIKNPNLIKQFQKEMGSYLPKKYQQTKF